MKSVIDTLYQTVIPVQHWYFFPETYSPLTDNTFHDNLRYLRNVYVESKLTLEGIFRNGQED